MADRRGFEAVLLTAPRIIPMPVEGKRPSILAHLEALNLSCASSLREEGGL